MSCAVLCWAITRMPAMSTNARTAVILYSRMAGILHCRPLPRRITGSEHFAQSVDTLRGVSVTPISQIGPHQRLGKDRRTAGFVKCRARRRMRMSKTVRLLALLLVIGCAHFADGQGVGVITGAVTDEQGTAISGVSVTAHGFDQSEIVKSDATGKFTLPPLMPRRYVVTAALDGFGTVVRSGV